MCTKAGQNCIRYKVIEILAGGGSALVEWRLETGRTHQVLQDFTKLKFKLHIKFVFKWCDD